MPQLDKGQRKVSFGTKGKNEGEEEKEPKKKSSKSSGKSTPAKKAPPKPPRRLIDDNDDEDDEVSGIDSDEDDDDEVIQASRSAKADKAKNNNKKFIILGVIVVVVVIFGFLILKGQLGGNSGSDDEEISDDMSDYDPYAYTDEMYDQGYDAEIEPENTEPDADPNIGVQDFSQETTMDSTSPMSDPEEFTKDLYGLTTRVDYSVASIQSAYDFVNYTKKRGTWGGGLELYYLEATYKNNKYVIQVPFQYYKELDETGIVPVQMEVLRIKSETDESYLTIISYMNLDVTTLEQVLRNQGQKQYEDYYY